MRQKSCGQDSSKYRLELWNCYGATKNAGCAFGTPDGDVIKELVSALLWK